MGWIWLDPVCTGNNWDQAGGIFLTRCFFFRMLDDISDMFDDSFPFLHVSFS